MLDINYCLNVFQILMIKKIITSLEIFMKINIYKKRIKFPITLKQNQDKKRVVYKTV